MWLFPQIRENVGNAASDVRGWHLCLPCVLGEEYQDKHLQLSLSAFLPAATFPPGFPGLDVVSVALGTCGCLGTCLLCLGCTFLEAGPGRVDGKGQGSGSWLMRGELE